MARRDPAVALRQMRDFAAEAVELAAAKSRSVVRLRARAKPERRIVEVDSQNGWHYFS